MRYFLMSCWSGISQKVQVLIIFLGCQPELDGKTMLLKTLHCLGCTAPKNQAGMEVETPHLRASFHSPRR